MSEHASSFERFRAFPRAIQWAVLAVLAVLLFLVWDEYIAPIGHDWNERADDIQADVNEVRAVHASVREVRNIEDVVTNLGPVEPPTGESVGTASFNNIVNQVIKKHGAVNDSLGFRSKGNLPKDVSPSISRNKRVERWTGDLKFDATPSAAAAIIADLEASPDIEAVESIRMTRDTQGKVKVHLTIEAWVLSSEAPKGEAP
jgi:hypothetical protein